TCRLPSLRPPPLPTRTHFPYTTLFRSEASARRSLERPRPRDARAGLGLRSTPDSRRTRRRSLRRIRLALHALRRRDSRTTRAPRSEEHTSELQSRFDLVCRLLLEQKQH